MTAKKITAALLTLIMALSLFSGFVNAETTPETIEGLPEFTTHDLWLAKALIGDYEASPFNTVKDFNDPVYRVLAEALGENKYLTTVSEIWSNLFNPEYRNQFLNEPQYLYRIILLDFLNYENAESVNWKLGCQATGILAEIENCFAEDGILDIAGMNSEEFSDYLMRYVHEGKYLDTGILNQIADGVENGQKLFDAITTYSALKNVKKDRIYFLEEARAFAAYNDLFASAADDILSMIDQPIEYVQDASKQYLWDRFCDDCLHALETKFPFLAVVNGWTKVLDGMFNTNDIASNNLKLSMINTLDYTINSSMLNSVLRFKEDETEENAQRFLACFEGYLRYRKYALEYSKTWITDCQSGGLLLDGFNHLFFSESIEDAESLITYTNAQIAHCDSMLRVIDQYAKLYYSLFGKNIGVGDFVFVDGVYFDNADVVIDLSDRSYYVRAYVTPYDATNQNVTYTCTNQNVLSVPDEGGYAKILSPGIVTITATTVDGGFTACQQVKIVSRVSNSTSASGACGEKLKWELFSNGVLYIYGSGDMSFDSSSAPWSKYKDSIKHVFIGDNVTSVVYNAFTGCSQMRKLRLPEGLTSIGDSAFSNCTQLESVEVPNSVMTLSNNAFSGCTSLTSITVPGRFQYTVNMNPWQGCTAITTIRLTGTDAIPSHLDSIWGGNLHGSLYHYNYTPWKITQQPVSVIVDEGIEEIGGGAFYGCSNLASVSLPDTLNILGEKAFYGCRSLASVSLPNTVTMIGQSCFSGCAGLSGINIPEGIETINDSTFYGCSGLKEVTIPENVTSINNSAFAYCSQMQQVHLSDNLTSIGDSAFSNCTQLESVEVPNSVMTLSNNAFIDCTGLTSITVPGRFQYTVNTSPWKGCTAITTIRLTGTDAIPSHSGSIWGGNLHGSLYHYNYTPWKITQQPVSVIVDEGIEEIGSGAFYGCSNLASVSLPNTLNKLGERTFYGCTGLTKINIPDGILTIDEYTFFGCSGFEEITIPDSVVSIGNNAFTGCSQMRKLRLSEGLTTIGDSAFSNCTQLESVEVPNSVMTLSNNAFIDCTGLTSITVPGRFQYTVNMSPWKGCTSITTIRLTGTDAIPSHSGYIWGGNLHGSLYHYNYTPWKITQQPVSVIVDEGIEEIGSGTFYGCSNLTSVSLPSTLNILGEKVFYGCAGLSEINIPEGIETINDSTFYGCSGLSRISIPENIKSINNNAFCGASLQTVCYAGSKEEWKTIGIGTNNTSLLNAQFIFSKFDIRISENTIHGTVNITQKIAILPGTEVGFSVIPDEQYTLYAIRVLDDSMNEVEITPAGDNTYILSMPISDIIVTGIFLTDPDHFSSNGDEYFIHDAAGWELFCDYLEDNAYNRFENITVILDADIDASRMAGSYTHEFCGIFDGRGNTISFQYGDSENPISANDAAPFYCVENGAVQNLIVEGDIYIANKFASGIAVYTKGSSSIIGCESAINIHSTVSGDGTHGGFVAVCYDGAYLTLEGCVFSGSIIGSATNSCAGLVGWYGLGYLTVKDCLMAGDMLVDTYNSGTLFRTYSGNGSHVPVVENCYYTTSFNEVQGKQANSITAAEGVIISFGIPENTYDVSGISAYAQGILYNGTFYAGEGDEVVVTLSYNGTPPEGYTQTGYTITLSDGRINMPESDVIIDAVYEETLSGNDLGARLLGYTISLDGDIGVNYYTILDENLEFSEKAYMEFTVTEEKQTILIQNAEKKDGYYIFKCRVAAKEMTEPIQAKIVNGEDSVSFPEFTVWDYANYLLTHDDHPDYQKAVPLVKAMLYYGARAQEYFEHNTTNLADKDLTGYSLEEPTIDPADPVISTPEGVTFEGATLSLWSETTLSLYFKSTLTDNLVFSCPGMTVVWEQNGDYQVARIRGIAAKDIGKSFTLKINGTDAVTYSPLNYCAKALAIENPTEDELALQNVVRALVLYWQAAEAYFGQN